MEKKLKVTWLGHSCFKLESHGYSVILDPYTDGKVPGLKNLREEADQVLCSHDHGDHNGISAITLRDRQVESPFQVTEISTYHDDKHGTLRGQNLIHLLDDGTFRAAHLGDLGCDLEEGQIKQLNDLDVVMIPVGGYYTIDAGQARELVEKIKPRVVIPMHYQGLGFGFEVVSGLSAYTDLCKDVVRHHGSHINVTAKTRRQTAVFSCPL